MPRHRRLFLAAAFGAAALLVTRSSLVPAHETQASGPVHLTIGWGEEPAYTGVRNYVSVAVSDAAGSPVTDPRGSLAVEVSFGDERITLPLLPDGQRKGELRAWMVPTRAGTYTFHITGSVKGQSVDARSTCSDRTFDCVTDISEIQFPVKEPSAGQLAERVGRALPRAEAAAGAAATARNAAIGAVILAALALAAAVGAGLRRGAKGA